MEEIERKISAIDFSDLDARYKIEIKSKSELFADDFSGFDKEDQKIILYMINKSNEGKKVPFIENKELYKMVQRYKKFTAENRKIILENIINIFLH